MEDLRTGEGEHYSEGIKEFCEGYPGMEERYFDELYDWEEIRTELVRMYVQDNSLDIEYYKDYGWDPVPIE